MKAEVRPASAPVLTAKGLVFGFDADPLLRGLDLSLAPGEIVGLIGPPSSGKSVLLKLLAGLLDPRAGEVSIGGAGFFGRSEADRYVLRRKIGMVFQNNALFDFLTIFDNVAFPLRMLPEPPEQHEIAERVRAKLADVGLGHAERQYPHELSGGMKKRAGLARATITAPEVCFYDEPTAGLDPVTAAKIYVLIQRATERDGASALVISNELDTLLPACHRVLMLYQGEIVYAGLPSGLASSTHPVVRQFVGGTNEGPL